MRCAHSLYIVRSHSEARLSQNGADALTTRGKAQLQTAKQSAGWVEYGESVCERGLGSRCLTEFSLTDKLINLNFRRPACSAHSCTCITSDGPRKLDAL